MRSFTFFFVLVLGCQSTSSPNDAYVPPDDGDAGIDASTDASANDPDAGSEVDAGSEADAGDAIDAGPSTPCYGNAPSCYGRNPEACAIGLGCTSRPICLGTAFACVYLQNQTECGAQLGCTWTGAGCVGGQTPCSRLDPATTCSAQVGCAVTGACEGIITECDALMDSATCLSQAGCAWEPTR